MSFLRQGYTVPKTEGSSRFLKFKKGEKPVAIRILSDAIDGYEWWTTDNKPQRDHFYPDPLPSNIQKDDDGNPKPARPFLAMVVWNYNENKVQIASFTQKTVIEAIVRYAGDPDWGHPEGYDLKITRTDEGNKPTTYTVVATPPKPFNRDLLEQDTVVPEAVDLANYMKGGNPFEHAMTRGVENTSVPAAVNTNISPAGQVVSKQREMGMTQDELGQLIARLMQENNWQIPSLKEITQEQATIVMKEMDSFFKAPALAAPPEFDDIPF